MKNLRELGKRKIVRQHNSLTVTLPQIWVFLQDIKPGNSVKMSITNENQLIIEPDGEKGEF